jgi:hypothetical protein
VVAERDELLFRPERDTDGRLDRDCCTYHYVRILRAAAGVEEIWKLQADLAQRAIRYFMDERADYCPDAMDRPDAVHAAGSGNRSDPPQ